MVVYYFFFADPMKRWHFPFKKSSLVYRIFCFCKGKIGGLFPIQKRHLLSSIFYSFLLLFLSKISKKFRLFFDETDCLCYLARKGRMGFKMPSEWSNFLWRYPRRSDKKTYKKPWSSILKMNQRRLFLIHTSCIFFEFPA